MTKKLLVFVFSVLFLSACQGGTKSDFGAGLWLQGKGVPGELSSDVPDTIYFPFDSSKVSEASAQTLRKQAKWWKDSNKNVLVVEGHCDERGTREYNLALGERRANSVKQFLISLGIPSNKIDTISYGKERPAVIGLGEEVWSKNRRSVTVSSN